MNTEDKGEFTKLLAASMDVYGRQITTGFVDIFFAALAPYDLATVREALSRHIQDPEAGRFAPKPADLIRQVVSAKSADGRPGRDEAWAIAQKAIDEANTVVVTEEILGALDIAMPLIELRDKVAARLAFVEAYDRLVGEKRTQGLPVEWQVSMGTDKQQRKAAIEQAAVKGLLPAPQATALLAHDYEEKITTEGLAIAGLLTGGVAASPEELRSRWQEIKSRIKRSAPSRKEETRRSIREAEQELAGHHASKGNQDEQGE